MNQSDKNNKEKSKITSKQIFAIAGIVILVLLYLVTLLAAFCDNSSSGTLFALCLFATIAIPVLIWIYTWMYGKLSNKSTFADVYPEKNSNSANTAKKDKATD